MKPTTEQARIIAAARAGKSISVQAGAGCGKSSTLRQIAEALPGKRILFVAYNRSVRLEMRGKMPKNVSCHTNHSYARQIVANQWRDHLQRCDIPRQPAKVQANILGLVGPERVNADVVLTPAQRARLAMAAITAWCKSDEMEPLPEHIPTPFGITKPEDIRTLREMIMPIVDKARADIRRKDGGLRWEFDFYLKMAQLKIARSGGTLPFDVIMMDECQDANPVAASLYLDTQTSTQRIIVGDSAQAINAWNGCIDILNTFPADERLTLSKSFRFGPAIADEANKWLELMGAPLRLTGHDPVPSRIGPVERPDAILCRTNAAAMAEVFGILRDGGTPALVGGGHEIASLAMGAILLKEGRRTDHVDLMAFSNWAEVQDYVAQDPRGQDLKVFVDLVDSYGAEAVLDAAKRVKDAEHAGPGDTVISTAHKSKGLEWDNVRIANDFRQPNPDADPPVDRDEMMLNYVAVTRGRLTVERGSLNWIDRYIGSAPRALRRRLTSVA